MNLIRVFLPHVLGIMGAILCLIVVAQFTSQRIMLAVISLPVYFLLFLTLVGLTPSRWLRAEPTRNQTAQVAVIFNFGYELAGEKIKPGEANQYLWEWTARNKPSQLRKILVQEGIWVAADQEALNNSGLEMIRIHRHSPHVYVDTLNAAFCSIEQIQRLGYKEIMLVAHDLQLQRVVWDFERIAQASCLDCKFVVPPIGDVPYPDNSVHVQTRNEFIYKIIELLIARPRDFLNPVPSRCLTPLNSK